MYEVIDKKLTLNCQFQTLAKKEEQYAPFPKPIKNFKDYFKIQKFQPKLTFGNVISNFFPENSDKSVIEKNKNKEIKIGIQQIKNFKLQTHHFKGLMKVLSDLNKSLVKVVEIMDFVDEDCFPIKINVPIFMTISGKISF